jgi:hypothetical protein
MEAEKSIQLYLKQEDCPADQKEIQQYDECAYQAYSQAVSPSGSMASKLNGT